MNKKIGILFGMENTFPPALVEKINSMKVEGVTAEFVKIGGIRMDICLAEAFAAREPVRVFAPRSRGASDYCNLADDLSQMAGAWPQRGWLRTREDEIAVTVLKTAPRATMSWRL